MWHVFIWLNVYCLTVYSQSAYLPPRSYYIDSLLHRRRWYPSMQETKIRNLCNKNPWHPLDKYREFLVNSSHSLPFCSYYNLPGKVMVMNNQLCGGNNLQKVRKVRKMLDSHQPHKCLSKAHLNEPEMYVLYKNKPPVPFHRLEQKPPISYYATLDHHAYSSEVTKSCLFQQGHMHCCKTETVDDSGMSSMYDDLVDVEISTKPVDIELVMPPPVIINNIGFYVSRPPNKGVKKSSEFQPLSFKLDQGVGMLDKNGIPREIKWYELSTELPIYERPFDESSSEINMNHFKKDSLIANDLYNFLKNSLDIQDTNKSTDITNLADDLNGCTYKNIRDEEATDSWSTDKVSEELTGNPEMPELQLKSPVGELTCRVTNGSKVECYLIEGGDAMSKGKSHNKKYPINICIDTANQQLAETTEILSKQDFSELLHRFVHSRRTNAPKSKKFTIKFQDLKCECFHQPIPEKQLEVNENCKNLRNLISQQTIDMEEQSCTKNFEVFTVKVSQNATGDTNSVSFEDSLPRYKRNTNVWSLGNQKRKRKREFVSSEYFSSEVCPRMHEHVSKYPKNPLENWNIFRMPHTRKKFSKQHFAHGRHSAAIKIPKEIVANSLNSVKYTKRMYVGSDTSENKSTAVINSETAECVEQHSTEYKDLSPPTRTNTSPTASNTFTTSVPSTFSTTNSFKMTKMLLTTISPYAATLHENVTPLKGELSQITPRLIPDTGNKQPSKIHCEEISHMQCICCIGTVVAQFNEMVKRQGDPDALLRSITLYNCSYYRPLNASYMLSSDLKPRLISKKPKEFIADDRTGPKELTTDTFKDLLYRAIPNEGMDFYIFPSTSIDIPCFSNDDIQLSSNTADYASYEWKHGDDRPITEGRVEEDVGHKGVLHFHEASGTDSDTYKCTVSYIDPDTDEALKKTFFHSIFVVQLPKIVLHTPLHYTAKVKCDQETLEMFELYLPQQIEELICSSSDFHGTKKACFVEIHNPLCQAKSFQAKKSDSKSVWHLEGRPAKREAKTSEEAFQMEMSMNYQVDMADVSGIIESAVNRTRCNPYCQLKILLQLVKIVRDSFVSALANPVKSGTGVTFEPDVMTMDVKMLISCEGGLQLFQGFCIPCPLHTFSEDGSTECTPCPEGTNQPNVGSKKCKRCAHPFEPGCLRQISSPGFLKWILIAVVFIVLATLLLITGGKCRKKKKKKNDLQTDSSARHKFKRIKYKRPRPVCYSEDSSDPPPLPSEDFTG